MEVEYITLPGWKSSISGVKTFNELPPNAKAYVEKLMELVGIPSELVWVEGREGAGYFVKTFGFDYVSLCVDQGFISDDFG